MTDVGRPDAAGRLAVTVELNTPEDAREYVLGFGDQVESIDPPKLREQVLARGVVALYGKSGVT